MTKEQFVRNNLFYGKDVNQTKPIPMCVIFYCLMNSIKPLHCSELLEEIYNSIALYPLRTERCGVTGDFTLEVYCVEIFISH